MPNLSTILKVLFASAQMKQRKLESEHPHYRSDRAGKMAFCWSRVEQAASDPTAAQHTIPKSTEINIAAHLGHEGKYSREEQKQINKDKI